MTCQQPSHLECACYALNHCLPRKLPMFWNRARVYDLKLFWSRKKVCCLLWDDRLAGALYLCHLSMSKKHKMSHHRRAWCRGQGLHEVCMSQLWGEPEMARCGWQLHERWGALWLYSRVCELACVQRRACVHSYQWVLRMSGCLCPRDFWQLFLASLQGFSEACIFLLCGQDASTDPCCHHK